MKLGKILKKSSKILLITILAIFLLVVTILVTAKLSENKITHLAFDKVSEMIDAPVKMDSVSLVLLRKFPYATIKFTGFHLGIPYKLQGDSITNTSDTLASLDHLYVSLKSRDLIDNKIEIEKIEIEGINIYYNIDSTGATNYDFIEAAFAAMDTTEIEENIVVDEDTTPSILDVLLRDLTLTDITLNYNDATTNTKARVHIPQVKLKGKVYDTYYAGSVKGSVVMTDLGFEDFNVNLMQKAYLKFDIDYKGDTATIDKLQLKADALDLNVEGSAIVGDSIYMDLGINLADINLAELTKYPPAEMLKEFGLNKVEGQIDIDTKVKGYYYDSLLLPQVDVNIAMRNGKVITEEYPPLNHISFNGSVTNGYLKNESTMAADFSSFKIKTNSSSVDLAFKVKNINKPVYNLKSDILIDIDEFTSFIPDSTVEYITGKVALKLNTHGQLPDDLGINSADYFLNRTTLNLILKDISTAVDSVNEVKNLNMNFAYSPRRIDLTGLSLEAPGYDIILNNSNLNAKILGSPTDIDRMGADIESFNFNITGASIGGTAYVKNLDEPTYKIDTDIKLNLEELKPFIPDSLVKKIAGIVNLSVKSFGTVNLDSIESQSMPIAFEQTELKLKVDNFMVEEAMQDPFYSVNDFDLNFEMADDTILIHNMFVDFNDLQFRMDSTEIWNVYKNILLEQKEKIVTLQTNMWINEFNYEKIMAMIPEEESATSDDSDKDKTITTETTDTIPEIDPFIKIDPVTGDTTIYLLPDFEQLGIPHFLARGKFAIDYIKYEENEIDNFSMMFRFSDSLYVIDQMKLNTFNGHMNTSLKFDARKNWKEPVVDVKNIIAGFDLTDLLKKNHKYVVDAGITHENLAGILTSELNARAFFYNGSWEPPTDRIRVKGHFNLKDGKVYNFEPLVEISSGLTNFGGLKDLEKLDFNTLHTSIFMMDDYIYIPETDISTSAMDLSVFAMQGMGDDYEYHIELQMGDVLAGKSKKLLKEQEKQAKKDGTVPDRNGMRLIAMDYDGEKKYGFDKEKIRKKFTTRLWKQEGKLNLIFFPDLVNFSTDMDRTIKNKE